MPYGFGPIYGTGTTDVIKTTAPVGTLTDRTGIYIMLRGWIRSGGGGAFGRFVELVDPSNVLLAYGSSDGNLASMARIGSGNASVGSNVHGVNARITWAGGYYPYIPQIRCAVNNTLTTSASVIATAPVNGAVHVAIGNSPSSLARHYDGVIDEVAVWLGEGLTFLSQTMDRRVFSGHVPFDFMTESSLVFYSDGQSSVNLVDGQPLTISGVKIYTPDQSPVRITPPTTRDPIRPSSMVRSYSNPKCGWTQMSRVLSDVR